MSRSWRRRDVMTAGSLTALLPLIGCDSRIASEPASRGFTFKDATGATIALAGPARRIVVLMTPDAASAIAVHGSPARLAGIHPRARAMFQRGFIARIFPEVLQIPTDIVVGSDFSPNVEGIAKLAPDVIVERADLDQGLDAPLEKLGLTVARYGAMHDADETVGALFTMLGAMIGDTSRAEFLIRLRTEVRQRLHDQLQAVPTGRRQRTMIVMPVGDGLMVSGGNESSLYAYSLYHAGGINVAASLADTMNAVGSEQIAAWNPQAMFVVPVQGTTPARIYNDPILGATAAARDRRVYVLPIGSHHWGSKGPEDPLVQLWMAELLYPKIVERSLRTRMRQAYRTLFDRTFSDDELDDVLLMASNGESRNYARFAR